MVGVRVELRPRAAHAGDPHERRDAAGIASRCGHASGDERGRDRALDLGVRRVEELVDVHRSGRRLEGGRVIGLVPDRPEVDERIAAGDGIREVTEPCALERRPGSALPAVRPAGSSDERHERRDPVRVQTLQDAVVRPPAVRGITRVLGVVRRAAGDVVPANGEANDVDAEILELVEPRVERARAVDEPRVILDPESCPGRSVGRRRRRDTDAEDGQADEEDAEPGCHRRQLSASASRAACHG